MSRKSVPIAEKRQRLLQLLQDKKQFYQLKEIERLAVQEKEIVLNSVKDVLGQLVDDGLVQQEKIAGSQYFWSFPVQNLQQRKRKLSALEQTLSNSHKKIKLIEENLSTASNDNSSVESQENNENVHEIQTQVDKLMQEQSNLIAQIARIEENNPNQVQDFVAECEKLKEAVNRWTDNIFNIKSWCKKKFYMEDKILNKQFGIPSELDYIS